MKNKHYLFIIFLILLFTSSCSRLKDRMFSRSYHAMVTKYNILFNGHEAYKKGVKNIQENYKDNFWKRLPIEPIDFDGTVFSNSSLNIKDTTNHIKSVNFERAEEKSVKAIQKHSMNIGGYEKNSQIDDAYLLLGKSRYYTKRFIPAIEAFNYIIANYPGANLNYETRVWRAKSNIRLGNEELAIETMNLLLEVRDKTETIPKRLVEEAYTTMAMAYAQTDSVNKFVYYLKKATETSYNREQTGRNLFILGQVYNDLGKQDSARVVFEKIAKSSVIPRKYRLHADVELAKFMINNTSANDLIDRLEDSVADSDNRKYYDQLYFQLANVYLKKGNKDKAIEYYEKSLEAKGGDYQKTHTYEKLGDLYFKDNDYLLAASYYDSVKQVVPVKYKLERRVRRIAKKNKGLVSLKNYENIVKKNDSILKLVSMTDQERVFFFKKHIEKLKEEELTRKLKFENAQNFSSRSFKGTNKWYYYNPKSRSIGKKDFLRVWGERELKDNWRLSSETIITVSETENIIGKLKQSKYELSTYIDAIPKNKKDIEALKTERCKALYKLGLIYKDQFKNYKLAIDRFERLKGFKYDESLELPLHYHLCQVYKEKGLNEKANQAKRLVVAKYPLSKYASLLSDKKHLVEKIVVPENQAAKKYKELYLKYEEGLYEDALLALDACIEQMGETKLMPKYALLKALLIGKLQDKKEFRNALEFVSFSFANTIEGKKAKELIKKIN